MPPSCAVLADLQSVHGLCCCGNITRNVSEYMLVLAVCQESAQLSALWLQSGCWKISTNAFFQILVLFLQHSRGNDVYFSFVHTYVMHFLCSLYVMPTVYVLSVAFVQMYLMWTVCFLFAVSVAVGSNDMCADMDKRCICRCSHVLTVFK